jgi:hypothetical protein
MPDGLTISGGGSYAVASDGLFADAEALERVRDGVTVVAESIARIDGRVGDGMLRRAGAPASAFSADAELERALGLLAGARWRAAALGLSLRAAAEGYGRTERASQRTAQQLAAALGFGIGRMLPVFAAFVAPALPSLVATALVVGLLVPQLRERAGGALGDFLAENNRLLTNPVVTALVRASVMSIDDVVGGAIGLPPGVMRALGDEGAGIVGLDTSAAAILALGAPAGLLVESAVAAKAGRERQIAAPPQGLAQRIDRVPERWRDGNGVARGSHIRIERYSMPNGPDRFEVYIAGTADFSAGGGTEAFDLTSDVAGVAGLPAGSVRAVQQAMTDAGVTAETPVQFTGYSQGGLVAATLAASGDYDTRGVFTAGAPTAQLELPKDIPVVELEHTDDIVPALGGMRTDVDALVVEREAFAGRETPTGVAVPAHARAEYRETAALADSARSAMLAAAVDRLDDFGVGASSITSTTYVAERVLDR